MVIRLGECNGWSVSRNQPLDTTFPPFRETGQQGDLLADFALLVIYLLLVRDDLDINGLGVRYLTFVFCCIVEIGHYLSLTLLLYFSYHWRYKCSLQFLA
jgi:hypothetical protein